MRYDYVFLFSWNKVKRRLWNYSLNNLLKMIIQLGCWLINANNIMLLSSKSWSNPVNDALYNLLRCIVRSSLLVLGKSPLQPQDIQNLSSFFKSSLGEMRSKIYWSFLITTQNRPVTYPSFFFFFQVPFLSQQCEKFILM